MLPMGMGSAICGSHVKQIWSREFQWIGDEWMSIFVGCDEG